jgi:glycine cleavage system H protein
MRFTQDHQWIELEGDVAAVGVTAYAAGRLGDVVFVKLPQVGQALTAGEPMAALQSVNMSMGLNAPVDGEVTQINSALPDTPELISQDPEHDAWLVKVKVADAKSLDALMDRTAYEAFLDTL